MKTKKLNIIMWEGKNYPRIGETSLGFWISYKKIKRSSPHIGYQLYKDRPFLQILNNYEDILLKNSIYFGVFSNGDIKVETSNRSEEELLDDYTDIKKITYDEMTIILIKYRLAGKL